MGINFHLWRAVLLLIMCYTSYSDVHYNCTTRPQFPNPYVVGNFSGEQLRLRLSVTPLAIDLNIIEQVDFTPTGTLVVQGIQNNCTNCFNDSYYTYKTYGQHCYNGSTMFNKYQYEELKRFQGAESYGHPRYCQGRRNNIFAQPQYGSASGSVGPGNTILSSWPSFSKFSGQTNYVGWHFQGFYYFGAPGRVGSRLGNPGFSFPYNDAQRRNILMQRDGRIRNGHTKYIQHLSDLGLFDTGGSFCPNISSTNYFDKCHERNERHISGYDSTMVRDIDRSMGVWDECVSGSRRSAYANFIGTGTTHSHFHLREGTGNRCKLSAAGEVATSPTPEIRWMDNSGTDCPQCTSCCSESECSPSPPSRAPYTHVLIENTFLTCNKGDDNYGLVWTPEECIQASNCTTCTGKANLHTRIGVSQVDEGPQDISADPYNPWAFTISIIYPTYSETSSLGSSFDFSNEITDLTAFCQSNSNFNESECQDHLKPAIREAFLLENENSHGYSPSNFGNNGDSTVNGRWDKVTERGEHLHSPPENWGASFEPTRALGPNAIGWPVDGIKNWGIVTMNGRSIDPLFDFTAAWNGVKRFINEVVEMPNVSIVPEQFRGKSFPRYKAPHVPNQPYCQQLAPPALGQDQPVYGCGSSCTNGCVPNRPSLHNPGPSFANLTASVNLVRVHKATVHFTCVRALLILQRDILNNPDKHEIQQHTYALARVLMKPQPGDAWSQKTTFRQHIMNGTYAQNSSGVWQMWQTGTTGLRTMEITPVHPHPSPATLQFTGVTQGMESMPGQLLCWGPGVCLS
ncbi:MAG: hypothetical protein J3K34DRAFT_236306 [Monoraphidium minutum]|nr:MAG: hypothetical protein J3K34DRAFT_236306 [Monoraphidium minutum]